jgi:hypothetical protein
MARIKHLEVKQALAQVRISQTLYDHAREWAAKNEETFSNLVRRLLIAGLARQGVEADLVQAEFPRQLYMALRRDPEETPSALANRLLTASLISVGGPLPRNRGNVA